MAAQQTPNVPTITFTRRPASEGLSTRLSQETTNTRSRTSPSGSPVFDVNSMCQSTTVNSAQTHTSPTYQPQYANGSGYTQVYSNGRNGGYAPPSYSQPELRCPSFRDGSVFAGLPYADVTDKNVELVKRHDRMGGMLTPYVCGNMCRFDWDYVKWFNNTFKKSSITLCTKCPYSVLIQTTKFPASDPVHPSATFTEVWNDDREYFTRMPETPYYANLRWLYSKRINRIDGFPVDMQRCKHAGKTFEQVLTEAPKYFEWITFNYSGQDSVYLDAMDWWQENKERAPLPDPVPQSDGIPVIPLNTEGAPVGLLGSPPPSLGVTASTKFQSGKHRNKTMFQVAVYDKEYFEWLETKCQSQDPLYQGAVEWYKANADAVMRITQSMGIPEQSHSPTSVHHS